MDGVMMMQTLATYGHVECSAIRIPPPDMKYINLTRLSMGAYSQQPSNHEVLNMCVKILKFCEGLFHSIVV